MTSNESGANTRTSRVIKASRDTIFRAFTDAEALVAWQAPGDMTARIHEFDLRVGGGYRMSLFYPSSDEDDRGKTSGREDHYSAQFLELAAPERIVEAITFDTDDPAFMGEMTIVITLDDIDGDTDVTMAFENLPSGIRTEDNDEGTLSSLEKLAAYVE